MIPITPNAIDKRNFVLSSDNMSDFQLYLCKLTEINPYKLTAIKTTNSTKNAL